MQHRDYLIQSGLALYGERWQTDLARDLGLKDGRRIRQWISGERPIPDRTVDALTQLLQQRQQKIRSLLIDFSISSPFNASVEQS